jgi:hypothetical protein
LSLLKNPINPFFVSEEAYFKFRENCAKKCTKLVMLDGMEIEMKMSDKASIEFPN